MGTATIKRIDKSNVTGLSKNKKDLLKKHMGSASVKIDLNKVRDWWKYENN
ncbi:hypothetical protein [Metabacillus arenae]|uniref:Uncharacterized protein n=1 Tax=Metabacillus arenae TaxID=2771434 RepID=A0A926RYN8_9BACI|nr:hypothetical protein [Metabacillus arenae]MBD1381347.1 hypothetical protein [Metabacillus arenae]